MAWCQIELKKINHMESTKMGQGSEWKVINEITYLKINHEFWDWCQNGAMTLLQVTLHHPCWLL